jgi:hypothetical protein
LLMQELVSQVADNKQLEHLLQHLDTPSTHTSAADTAGGATCCSEPAWSNGQQQQQQPWGQVGSNMRCPPDPAAAAAAGGQAPGQWPTTTTLQPDCSTLQCQGSTLNQASAAAGLDQGSAAGLDQGAAAGLDQGAAAGLDQRSFTGVVPPTYMQTSLCEGEEALLQVGRAGQPGLLYHLMLLCGAACGRSKYQSSNLKLGSAHRCTVQGACLRSIQLIRPYLGL